MRKHLSNKYSQKRLNNAKKSTTDTIKTASKRAIQKTAEASVDLIGNKIVDKITNLSKKSSAEFKMKYKMIKQKCQEKDIYLQKKDNKLLMN